MTPQAVTEALASLELELQAITESLADADSIRLLAASDSLKQGALNLLALVRQLAPAALLEPQIRRQILQLNLGLALGRENLARRSAIVERRLQTIVPAAGVDTYASLASPYAKLGRQSAWSGARAA